MSAPRLSGGSSRGSFCRYRISVCSACRRRRLPCADGEARRGTSKRTRRAKDPRRPRRGTSDCGPARTRKRHRTHGPPRTSAPTTAPHGNPADTAHGRVALVATEAARVHCAPGTGGSRLSRPRRRWSIGRRADGRVALVAAEAARHVHGNAIGRAGRRGRRPLPRHHMVTRRIRRTGGSRLSRPRAARVHCASGTGRSRQARPSRTAAPRTRDRASCTGGRT